MYVYVYGVAHTYTDDEGVNNKKKKFVKKKRERFLAPSGSGYKYIDILTDIFPA